MVGAPMLTETLEDATVEAAAAAAPETMVRPARAPAVPPAARMASSTHFLCDFETLTGGPDLGSEFLRVMVASLTGCRLTAMSAVSATPAGPATAFRLRASICGVR